MKRILFLLLASLACTNAHAQATADLLISGGPIYTVSADMPMVEAVLVKGDIILFAGTLEEAQQRVGAETRILDLEGKTMIPGFIEGHGHLLGMGYGLQELDLAGTINYAEIVDEVAAQVATAQPGEWIIGNGWHQSKWDTPPPTEVKGFQTNALLNEVSQENPVLLNHASGHALIANARALELAGITDESLGVEGGEIIRDADGKPTGILTENAMNLVFSIVPEDTLASHRTALKAALAEIARNGVTSFQDAGSERLDIEAIRSLMDEEGLTARLWLMVAGWNEQLLAQWLQKEPEVGLGNNFLTIRAIKLSADGALGSRGAWLLEPYADRPGHSGAATLPMETVLEVSKAALRSGYQLCVHAIGDRANREVLDQFEIAFHGEHSDARFRIEHAQHLSLSDIERFAQLGVIPSMQGIHLSSDRPWAIDRLGQKRIEEGAYVWRKLIDSGAVLVNGTDVPVEPINPLASFYALVSRKTLSGTPPGGYEPGQKLTRAEALRSYTLNAAYAAFEDDIKGSIEAGKLADFTILSGNLMTVPEDEILGLVVEQTIVGGTTVFSRSD